MPIETWCCPDALYTGKGAQMWMRDGARTFFPPLRLATLSLAYFLPLPLLNIIDIDIDIMSVIHLYSVFSFCSRMTGEFWSLWTPWWVFDFDLYWSCDEYLLVVTLPTCPCHEAYWSYRHIGNPDIYWYYDEFILVLLFTCPSHEACHRPPLPGKPRTAAPTFPDPSSPPTPLSPLVTKPDVTQKIPEARVAVGRRHMTLARCPGVAAARQL